MSRSSSMRHLLSTLAALVALGVATGTAAQVRLDRADPSITEQALPRPTLPPTAPVPPTIPQPAVSKNAQPRGTQPFARRITVTGNPDIPSASFDRAIAGFVGRELSTDDLAALAGAVAAVARSAGFPFATASIEPQSMAGGTLQVTLDEGRIDAVRVLGASHPVADNILTGALANGRPLRRETLERAITLVGDLPGVTVKDSRYIRQDGFGILLVTIAQDKAAAYLQVDNRGSAEVGPVRSTALASLRDVLQSGDEFGLLASNTPFQPSEFAFVRGRYSAPVDRGGSVVSTSVSYGRAHPGAALTPLKVIGHSVDVAVAYSRPLLRNRTQGMWFGAEFRSLKSDQTLLGRMFRDDRLTTLAVSINGTSPIASGYLRGEVTMVGGLPLPGVTRRGDARTSRPDGDARFVTWGYSLDWTAKLTPRVSVALASAGQVASRPLLASAEIGVGGPVFGRGFDYAERTGDSGILGSAELRADAGRVLPKIIDRLQFYGFVDGGHVDNLRHGIGGGSLLSTGTGARLGRGRLDGMVEIAFPLNADRLTSGDRSPRLSLRLSRSF